MRVSYNWLKTYLDIDLPAEELARRYTAAGLEYDEVITIGDNLDKIVVAKIISCAKVENSDHLQLCQVDIGGAEALDIICGAPNARAGLLVACATVGAILPEGFAISAKKTFGIVSQGMLCSQKELGLSDDHSGIWELNALLDQANPPLGMDIVDALNLHDEVLLIELTPNRSDCLGMLNLAREAAAYIGKQVKYPELSYAEKGEDISGCIYITVEDEALCPRYDARLVKGVKIGSSPLWMQNYLRAAGMRSINNVVDISNFVMLEMNQPLHTFDYQKLRGQQIMVRAAKTGETMQTLDGKDRQFKGGEILICDGEGPVCIAGVMGGMDTEVTTDTTDVLIESAAFNPLLIRRTSRALGIPSESSMRFEKGVDMSNCDAAAKRAAQLLVKYCGGVACAGAVDVCSPLPEEKKILLRTARVNDMLGTAYATKVIKDTIASLGFGLAEAGDAAILVSVPSYRQDITLEVDLIEEVARLQGYDTIPKTLPQNNTIGGRSDTQELLRQLKNICVFAGLNETVNYSFIDPKEADLLQLNPKHAWRTNLAVSNPLSEEQSIMRQSLLPGLLHAAERNLSRRNLDIRLFELGNIFAPAAEDADKTQPTEILTLSLLVTGAPEPGWQEKAKAYDYFTLKGMVEYIAAKLGLKFDFARSSEDYLHPGRAAAILLDGLSVGLIGELHPAVAENYQLAGRTIVAELSVTPLLMAALSLANRKHDLPRYPASTRDIALIGSDEIPQSAIAEAICAAGGEFLQQVKLFDLYDQAPIPAGKRSLAYALLFQSEQGTLTDKEVDQAFDAIVKTLADKYNYLLR